MIRKLLSICALAIGLAFSLSSVFDEDANDNALDSGACAWQQRSTFHGASSSTTDFFSVLGKNFRVKYTITDSDTASHFSWALYEEGNSVSWDTLEVNSPGSNTEEYDIGPRDFYFDIEASSLTSWSIEVDDCV
jgi:hypothetical protein